MIYLTNYNFKGIIMNIIETIASKTVINKCVQADANSAGLSIMHQCFVELDKRLKTKQNDRHDRHVHGMRNVLGEDLELAYKDFAAFAAKWKVSICYWDHPEKSNIFIFRFAEKNDCPRSFEFVFRNLTNSN